MQSFLVRVGRSVARRPVVTLVILIAITGVMGVFASQQQVDTDLTAFGVDSDLYRNYELVQEEFAASGSSMQVIVDAGDGGDVLSPQGLQAAARITQIAATTPEVAGELTESTDQVGAIVGFQMPFQAALQTDDLSQVDEAAIKAIAPQVLSNAQASALLSSDLDAATGSARGGIVVVRFAPDANPKDVAEAELALNTALGGETFDGVQVTGFGQAIFTDELETSMNEELPMLLGLSFLLIIVILWFTYRRLSDVVLGILGLGMTIVWMYGAGVLLGPDYLGITGVFSQIAIVVPVLLIGLGIDYAIHLTSRYREEMSQGADPQQAAASAISTVGMALILATVTTLVGFLTNVFSPLPPIKDFGIFIAAGVVAAFVIFVFGTPAIRSLIDRRRAAKGKLAIVREGQSSGLASFMGRTAVISERAPLVTLAIALIITIAAGIGGSRVSTTFSQSDFIPADSDIGRTIDRMTELFGGAVDETTYVLMQGDLATPDAFNAMLQAQAAMADDADVRVASGYAQALSPAAVVTQLAGQSDQFASSLAPLGLTVRGVTPDADVAAIYAATRQAVPGALDFVLRDDNSSGVISVSTTAGQDRVAPLADEIGNDVVPLADAGIETSTVSENLVLDEILTSLTSSQTRSIIITLVAALALLVLYFWVAQRRPLLGVAAMLPSILVVAWVLGSMWLFGLSFNVLTATVASLAIGIGVPYGIHIAHRFLEDLEKYPDIDMAIKETITHTGGAVAGSAATTAAGFGVLGFASLVPIQQFGLITALTIAYSLIGAIVVEPAALKMWARWRVPHKSTGQPSRNRDRSAARA